MARIGIPVVLIAVCLVGCSESSSHDRRLQEARDLFRESNWSGAVRVCSELLAQDPENFDAVMLRGRANLMRDELSLAIDDFTQAIQIDESNPEPYYQRAIARDELGQAELAERDRELARTRDLEWKKLDAMRYATLNRPSNYIDLDTDEENPHDPDRVPEGSKAENGLALETDEEAELRAVDLGDPMQEEKTSPNGSQQTAADLLRLPGNARLPAQRVADDLARRIRLPDALDTTRIDGRGGPTAAAIENSPLMRVRLPDGLADETLATLITDPESRIPALAGKKSTRKESTSDDKQDEREQIDLERQSQEESESASNQPAEWSLPSGNAWNAWGGVVPQTGSSIGQMPIRASRFNGVPETSLASDTLEAPLSSMDGPSATSFNGYSTLRNAPPGFALQFVPRPLEYSRPATRSLANPTAPPFNRSPTARPFSPAQSGGYAVPQGLQGMASRRPAPPRIPEQPTPPNDVLDQPYTWDYLVPFPGLEIPTTGIVHDPSELDN